MAKFNIKNESITKFDLRDKVYYVKVFWKQNESDNNLFHMKIYDGDNTWSGKYSNAYAKKYRERFDEDEEQYYETVRVGLSGDHNDFTYSFTLCEDNTNAATFTWKKRVRDSLQSIAVMVHGSVPMYRDSTKESKDVLLDFLLSENDELRRTISLLNEKNEDLMSDLEKCKVELEKFVGIKSDIESNLYEKFLQLLNAKKKRIQLIEETLQRFPEAHMDVTE